MEVRQFETGATRSPLKDKLQYEGFLSPLVLKRYAEYMHIHQKQTDGKLRTADNWQKGMPTSTYIDSAWRHFEDWWLHHRGFSRQAAEGLEDSLCALMFNTMGYLFEVLKEKDASKATRETGAPNTFSLFDRLSPKSPSSPYRPDTPIDGD